MNKRDLFWCLGLEVFAVLWAGAAFGLISNRLVAGGVAGLYFIGSATAMLFWLWRWKDKWRSLMIYPLAVHLFAISVPMVVVRFLNPAVPFDELHIWGLAGPQFHKLSGQIFTILVAATVLDLCRIALRDRRSEKVS